jgi:hypothetical protein
MPAVVALPCIGHEAPFAALAPLLSHLPLADAEAVVAAVAAVAEAPCAPQQSLALLALAAVLLAVTVEVPCAAQASCVLLAVTVALFSHAARIAAVHCALVMPGHWAVAGQSVAPPLAAVVAVVALVEVAEAADLAWSHASAAEAVHVQVRSARMSSRSDFMEPTSRKVMTPGNRPGRASPASTLESSAGLGKACHRPMWAVSGMCKKAAPGAPRGYHRDRGECIANRGPGKKHGVRALTLAHANL